MRSYALSILNAVCYCLDVEKIRGKWNHVLVLVLGRKCWFVWFYCFYGTGSCEAMIDFWILNAVCLCQVDVILSDGSFHRAAVPSGASTGKWLLFVWERKRNVFSELLVLCCLKCHYPAKQRLLCLKCGSWLSMSGNVECVGFACYIDVHWLQSFISSGYGMGW